MESVRLDAGQKVFGIGWARTGTTTLGRCFEILGFKHQGQALELVEDIGRGDLTRALSLARAGEAFEDWPWILLFREMDAAFPGSRFILTTRKSGNWLRSYRRMLAAQGKSKVELNEIRRILYGLPFPDVTDAQLLERYERHNADVRQYFHDRPEDLLVVDWEQGSGWLELCAFLGCEIPDQPFPHENRSRSRAGRLLARVARRLSRRSG